MSIKKGYKVIAGAPLEPVWGNISGDITDQADLLGLFETKADANSATLTGTPTAPTPPEGSDDDRIATTAFLHRELERIEALPSQSGHNGQFLTTNGTTASWATVDALPSQTSQAGKFLTTNGTTASWANIDLSGKRDIITNASRVYTTDNSGNQSEHYYSNTPYNNAIAVFDGSAHLKSSAPSADNDVTTKKYVDDGLKEKLNGYNINVAGAWTGGAHAVKFVTVDYSGADSENGVFIKISMVNSHGNDITGRFFQDIILNVNYTGTVAGTIYRYFAESVNSTFSYSDHKWGDVFWTIDTTNKIVKFFVIMRQYSYTYETPYFRLNVSTKGEITQHSGVNSEEYSSGTQYWATIYDYNEIPVQTGQSGKFLTTNGTSVSWTGISQVPSQSGQSGKFLTTNGTTASWANVDAFPSQSGNNGKFLTTNGTAVSWATVDAFPTQAGNNGKFLTTDGTNASWATVDALPSQTSQSGKFLTTNGTTASWASLPTYSSGTGITVSGTTINHSNSVTAGTAGTSSATSGSTLAVPYVTYDAQGHITASGTHTHTVTGFLTQNDVTSTYSDTGTAPLNGQAVKSAIDSAISSVYKPAGSVAFANRPSLSKTIEGNVYNITDNFTTTSDFVEGAGKSYPAGTNIVCINTVTSGTAVYKWDVLAGMVDLSNYQTLITSTNKLNADLVDDSSSTNKFVTSSEKTSWNNKVDITGDTMTGNLQIQGAGLYLTSIGSSVAASTSRLNLGTPGNVYSYLTGNSQGAFGIYSEKSGTRTGIACYPGTNFFADATTKTMDLGRSNNVWKIGYIDTLSNGSSSISLSDLIAKQDAITDLATIRSGAAAGATALQSGDNISELNNDAGYTSNVGTVTSVNNVQPVNGNVSISVGDTLPSQTGQSGKFLTTDGTTASWAESSGSTITYWDDD